ncbi:hypothetical protein JL722_2494 [Aureococcus anophagefferens]|nr:hypothetical protein JL722_2494 [Aureococcus anophagefferens]
MGGMRAGEAPYHAPYYVPYPPPPGAYAAPAHGPGMPYYVANPYAQPMMPAPVVYAGAGGYAPHPIALQPVRDCGGDPAYPYKRARRGAAGRRGTAPATTRPSTGRRRGGRIRSEPADALAALSLAPFVGGGAPRRRRATRCTISTPPAPRARATGPVAAPPPPPLKARAHGVGRVRGVERAGSRADGGRRDGDHATEARHTGVVRWYTEKKHYGFIESKGASATDLFVHSSELEEPLRAGDTVSFVIGERRGRSAATKVEVVERAPLPPPAQSALDP